MFRHIYRFRLTWEDIAIYMKLKKELTFSVASAEK